jgi:hypothetical protein
MLREPDFEAPDHRVRAHPVEDEDAASALERYVAGQAVDQLAAIAEATGVEDVASVEDEEHNLRMPRMEPERAYLDELTRRLRTILADEVVGVYAGGSYALGGYEPRRSDLDVAGVVRRGLREDAPAQILAAVGHEALPCPARKLELVIYSSEAAKSRSVEPSFELNLNTGPSELRVDLDPQPRERHWFAIDRSVLAQSGIALFGPPARVVFASPPRSELLLVLADVLRWYRENEPESEDALLNVGRSLRFASEGVWAAKPELREWAATAPPDALERAVAELESA